MRAMNPLDYVRSSVRAGMRRVARALNTLSRGKLSPNTVTLFGFAMHIPIAYLIAVQHFYWAAGLLVLFGLFDALDGELARLQKRASSAGMVLDASTDRMKEVLLYSGGAYALVAQGRPSLAVWAVAACGASLCVSYVKAKGETAVKDSKLTPNEINRLFADGLMRFEVRMAVLVVGLIANQLAGAIVIIALSSALTAMARLARITRNLSTRE